MIYNKWALDFEGSAKWKSANFHLERDHIKNKFEREILQAEVGFSRHWQKLSSSIGSMLGSGWSGVIPTCSPTSVSSHIWLHNSWNWGDWKLLVLKSKALGESILSNQRGIFQKKWDAPYLVNVCMSWSFITGNCDCHAWTIGQCKHRLYFPVNFRATWFVLEKLEWHSAVNFNSFRKWGTTKYACHFLISLL